MQTNDDNYIFKVRFFKKNDCNVEHVIMIKHLQINQILWLDNPWWINMLLIKSTKLLVFSLDC